MIESIQFMPVREARKLSPSLNTALISIHDADESVASGVPTDGWGYFSHIGIDDAAYSIDQIEDHGEDFWNYFDGCARKVHALRILLMFKQIEQTGLIEHVIIHCDSGRSRSAAVAKYYAEKHGLDLDRETTYANSLIYQLLQDPEFFDEALKKHVEGKSEENGEQEKRSLASLLPFGWIDVLLEKIFGKPAP